MEEKVTGKTNFSYLPKYFRKVEGDVLTLCAMRYALCALPFALCFRAGPAFLWMKPKTMATRIVFLKMFDCKT